MQIGTLAITVEEQGTVEFTSLSRTKQLYLSYKLLSLSLAAVTSAQLFGTVQGNTNGRLACFNNLTVMKIGMHIMPKC